MRKLYYIGYSIRYVTTSNLVEISNTFFYHEIIFLSTFYYENPMISVRFRTKQGQNVVLQKRYLFFA